jgi:glycosyltransferase involved in cell wall biosynthesis
MNTPQNKDRILIFIVTYNHRDHIQSVLNRLPSEIFNNQRFHVLVIDDCSRDNTAEMASIHMDKQGYKNVTVLRNSVNQGYGGNQKIGFHYAIQEGFSLVILLHGDGQYAPEIVSRFVTEWEDKRASVVLGSRMMDKRSALRGRMPFYKWVGNQILTFLQNDIVGTDLSEFHTGYRAYDVDFLKKVPFDLNTNDFHFDTEILLQAFALESRVVEFPIPTHYGEEVCHVNGFAYGWNVLKASLKYRFQKIGFFSSMQYRNLLKHQERYSSKLDQLGSTHYHVLKRMTFPSRVLDLGCGPGYVSQKLKSLGCQVVGMDIVEPVNYPGDRFIRINLENEEMREDISKFDFVLLLDVIEHLSNPERFLINCRYSMGTFIQPTFLISTGNVAFLGVRILLSLGLFTYGERGILDVTHKRLFTLSTFRRLLKETGYEIGPVRGLGVPFQLVFPNWFGKLLSRISYLLARTWPSLFAYQFLIEAKPNPNSFSLLKNAEWYYGTKVSNTSSTKEKKDSPPITV